MDNKTFELRENLKDRTKKFALRIIKLSQALTLGPEACIIRKQMLQSGTSIAAKYRSACIAKSNAEFLSKISIAIGEAEETMLWIELLQESAIIKSELLADLYRENEEILKLMETIRDNSKKIK